MMKVALVENFGADFVGARLRFAVFLKNSGVDVTAIIPQDGHKEIIEKAGIKVIEVGANIRGNGLSNKFAFGKILKQILQKEAFDVVHFYRLQPNIIGTIIAGLFTKSKIVNHVTGLGVAFTSNSFKNSLLQLVIKSMYQFNSVLFKPHTVYQNKQDVLDLGVKRRAICIEGSAVNEDRFNTSYAQNNAENIANLKETLGLKTGVKTFIFVSRLLKEKGVLQLVEAFINLNTKKGKEVNLLVVGWSDAENPSAVTPEQLTNLTKEHSFIKFLGKRSDVNDLLALSDASILPTYYREGTPRFLLESMAMAKPIITTNMPGCDHLIPNKENGVLIAPKNVEEIEQAVLKIVEGDSEKMGQASAKLYQEKFSEKVVYNAIVNLYKSIV